MLPTGEPWGVDRLEANPATINFGAFVGDPTRTKLILERIVNEAKRLKVKEVCICECGTAYRVMKQLSGKQPFKVTSITEPSRAVMMRSGATSLECTPAPSYTR